MSAEKAIRKQHLRMAEERGIEKTYCPSEVARAIFPSDKWRQKMNLVREIADDLVGEGKLEVLQNAKPIGIKPSHVKGPIRLRLRKPMI